MIRGSKNNSLTITVFYGLVVNMKTYLLLFTALISACTSKTPRVKEVCDHLGGNKETHDFCINKLGYMKEYALLPTTPVEQKEYYDKFMRCLMKQDNWDEAGEVCSSLKVEEP